MRAVNANHSKRKEKILNIKRLMLSRPCDKCGGAHSDDAEREICAARQEAKAKRRIAAGKAARSINEIFSAADQKMTKANDDAR